MYVNTHTHTSSLVKMVAMDTDTCTHAHTHHKTEQSCEDGCYRPGWIPSVRVEITDGEAEPCVDLETAVRCDHEDPRRLEGVVLREQQLPVIIPTWGKGCGYNI